MMTDSDSPTQTKVDPKTGLVDIHDDPAGHRTSWWMLWVAILSLVVFVFVFALLPATLLGKPWFLILLVGVGIGVCTIFYFRRRHLSVPARVRTLIVEKGNLPFCEPACLVLGKEWDKAHVQDAWTAFSRSAAEHERVGVVRTGLPSFAEPIEPIAVPFEPTLLNEVEPSLLGLDGVSRGTSPVAPSVGSNGGQPEAASVMPPSLKRAISLQGRWRFLAFVVSVCVYVSFITYEARGVTGLVVAFLLCMGPALFGTSWRDVLGLSKEWLLVPGGLVVRRPGWLRRGWGIHLFNRENSVLGVHQVDKRKCMVCIAVPRPIIFHNLNVQGGHLAAEGMAQPASSTAAGKAD